MKGSHFEFFEIRYLIRDLFHLFAKRIEQQTVEPVKITHEQFALLFAISNRKEEVIQQDMAEMMKKDKSVVLRIIDSLEEKDLIRRVVDKNDRRKNCLMITKAGARVIGNYQAIGEQIIEEIHQGIDEEELKVFYKVIKQMTENTNRL